MAYRITDDMIKRRVARLQKEGLNIELDGAYSQWKVVEADTQHSLTPRAPNREIMNHLETLENGWDMLRNKLVDYCVGVRDSRSDEAYRETINKVAGGTLPWHSE